MVNLHQGLSLQTQVDLLITLLVTVSLSSLSNNIAHLIEIQIIYKVKLSQTAGVKHSGVLIIIRK